MTTDDKPGNAEMVSDYFQELKKKLESQTNQAQPCPSCGHCPTCGRGGYHTQPNYWPYWHYYQPSYTICNTSGGG